MARKLRDSIDHLQGTLVAPSHPTVLSSPCCTTLHGIKAPLENTLKETPSLRGNSKLPKPPWPGPGRTVQCLEPLQGPLCVVLRHLAEPLVLRLCQATNSGAGHVDALCSSLHQSPLWGEGQKDTGRSQANLVPPTPHAQGPLFCSLPVWTESREVGVLVE